MDVLKLHLKFQSKMVALTLKQLLKLCRKKVTVRKIEFSKFLMILHSQWNCFWHRIRKNNFLKIRKAKHAYYLRQNTIIYFRLLVFMKLPKFSCCPWKWIPAESDNFWYRPHDMINLFNFAVKTVVHIIIKYDNSQIKMEKKSVKLSKISTVW